MKLTSQDFRVMRASLLAGVMAVSVSVALIWLSLWYEQRVSTMEHVAQSQLALARQQLTSAQQDALNMQAYLVEYAQLTQGRIIGEEQRVDWLETAAALQQQAWVADFHYRMDPQQRYPSPFSVETGHFVLYRSPMKLELSLQHEQQLVHFLKALTEQSTGWFQLTGCTLQRISDAEDSLLSAHCQGDWITLNVPQEVP
ncbi:MAG: hypothetical protein PHU06_09360 [Gallionella sp.]|nr:hypothetical protein [Gallionella sp.]MDD4959583.1 hypothetical protein [Gallionella sp.]